MKSSKLFFALSIALFASLLYVSAATFSVSPASVTFTNGASQSIFTVTNTDANASAELFSLSFNPLSITAESKIANFFVTGNSSNINSTGQFTISTPFTEYSSLVLGKTYSGNLIITRNNTENQTFTVNLIRSYCSGGEAGTNLSVTDVSINNLDGDDSDWMPLDNIEVKVEVENFNSDSSDRIKAIAKIGLFDSKGKDVLKLDTISVGRIDGGDYKRVTFKFQVPSTLGDKESSYRLYAKAYQDGSESQVCSSQFEQITVDRESDTNALIKLDSIELDENTTGCNSESVLKATVYNVGDENQDKVKINLFNNELNLNQYVVLDGFDVGDSERDIEFRFVVPKNMSEKVYKLQLRALYTYDDDKSEEQDSSYDDKSGFYYTDFNVKGNCPSSQTTQPSTNDASISAVLTTDAVAGKEIIIKATITNLASSIKSFTVLTSGIENFGAVQSVEPSSLTLAAGESQDVLITLKSNPDSAGDHSFSIKTVYDGKLKEQPVSFKIEAQPGVAGLFSNLGLGQNWVIWAIVLVNVILLILIIIVAVKLSKG